MRCKICRTEFVKRSIRHKVCGNVDCALAWIEQERAKKLHKKQIADRRDTKLKLDKLKTRSDYIKAAQVSFNRYIRIRAIRYNHLCISSGDVLPREAIGGGFDAGHFRSIGSAPHLRFNLNNCWGQSKRDNRYGAGAHSEYRKGLIAFRGIDVVEKLENDNTPRKFDIDYLKRIKNIFDRKAKRTIRYV